MKSKWRADTAGIIEWIKRVRQWRYIYPLGVFIILRLWLSVWAGVTIVASPVHPEGSSLYNGMPPLESGLDRILWSPWQRWDTLWYTKIAAQGYPPDEGIAFFPLFPILISFVAPFLGNNLVAAGVLISSAATLISFILLYSLTADLFDVMVARNAVLFLAVFPTTFFFFAAYPESLFLVLVLVSFLAMRSSQWGIAGLAGGLVALTRPQGMLLVLPLLIGFFQQYRQKRVTLIHGASLLLVVTGGVGFLVYLAVRFQSPFVWFQAQANWRHFAMPWESIGTATGVVLGAKDLSEVVYASPDLIVALLFVGLTIWSAFRLGATMTAYMAVVILPPLFGITTYERLLPLASLSRYVLAAFPGFILLAQIPWLVRWRLGFMTISLLLQTFGLILFSHWFFMG